MPSSRFLVNRLVAGIDFSRATEIVELGVGTGCVTREILHRMRPDARLVSLEINPEFVQDARRRFRDPRLLLRVACAGDLRTVLDAAGIGPVDAVVSSLPLKIMDDELVDRILDVSRACLRPDGRFHQYQYSLASYKKLAGRYAAVGSGSRCATRHRRSSTSARAPTARRPSAHGSGPPSPRCTPARWPRRG